MKLFLRDDVSKLGKAGDLVDVADGYARNFLLPRKLAYVASTENEKRIKAEAKRRTEKELERVESLKELAKLLDGRSVTIKARANEEQKLFGSVGPEAIAEAIRAEHGAQVDPAHVALDDHISELGVFDVAVRLDADVESTVKVWVVQEG
ncbi:MAG: 50S ribosomal protein L9 [Planctomycetota bacterium]|jgi:large subunit ribosomal protein L9